MSLQIKSNSLTGDFPSLLSRDISVNTCQLHRAYRTGLQEFL